MPYFSIILPTYNRAKRLSAAIASVLEQKNTDWELIIIDDGSTDSTSAVVSQFNDPRIRYFYQENKERSAARNKGLELATGEYICFLDSDDRYAPNHLDTLHHTIQQKGGDILRVYTCYEAEDQGLEVLQPIPPVDSPLNADAETHFVNVVCNPTALCVKTELANSERFDESLNLGEDFDYIIRILRHNPLFIPVPEHTVIMVEHAGSTQNQKTPEFHERYIASLKSILYRGLVSNDKNKRTLLDRIIQRYRWMAECYRLQGKTFLYWYYRIFARLSK